MLRMESLTLPSLIVTLLTLFLMHRYYLQRKQYQADKLFGDVHSCLPTRRLPNEKLFGIDRLYRIWKANSESRLLEHFHADFCAFGNTFDMFGLGNQLFVTIEPENIRAILATSFEDWGFGFRRQIMWPLLGDGIFSQEGAAWKHSRKLLVPQFHFKQYQNLEILREPMDDLLRCIEDGVKGDGGVVDLQPLFFRFTLDSTTAFLLGESVNSLKSGAKMTEFERAFNSAQSTLAARFQLANLYWVLDSRNFRKDCKIVQDFCDAILARSLDEAGKGDDRDARYLFLDAVAKEYPNRVASRQQMMNILIAGRDTTATLLSWTLHPDVLNKLKKEIEKTFAGSDSIDRQKLKNMNYLTKVLKEILRLYPSVPFNQRTALKTTTLPTGGGPTRTSPVLIRKGQSVAYSPYSLHRREDLFGADAEDFRPERWDEDIGLNKDELTKAWGYVPFNGGPRVCLGMDLAMIEVAYAVVAILRRFPAIGLPHGERVAKSGKEAQVVTITLAPAEGCRVRLG